jgi:hypothetical protein
MKIIICRVNVPPLHPIPVHHVFQIVGVDIMDLPKTEAGSKHVVFFQYFLSKYHLVFPTPDQKSVHIARLLVEEMVPFLVSQRFCWPTEELTFFHT